MATTATSTDQPNWISPVVQAMLPALQRCRDARAATPTFREKKETYLPKFESEERGDWQVRVALTVVMDFMEQAITTLVGLGLKYDPELGPDTPEVLQEDWENLDGEGNHGAVVVQQALDNSLCDGHIVYFTEAPPAPPGLTQKQQDDLGIRPYVVTLKIDNIPSFRTRIVGGKRIVSQLVVEESADMSEGAFGSTPRVQYKVYKQQYRTSAPDDAGGVQEDLTQGFVTWELWEAGRTDAQSTTYTLTQSGTLFGQIAIPARVAYGGKRLGMLRSQPPLDGLAYSVIRWAQVMSDRAFSLHKCGIPIAVIIGKLIGNADGKPPEKIILSSSKALQIEAGGDFKIIEAQGTALEQARLELQDWEKRIASQAIAMLQRDTAAAETATANRFQRNREVSKLLRALRSHEDALEGVLQDMARYHGLKDADTTIDVTIRRDVGDIVPPEVLTLLSSLEEKGQLTMLRLITELQRAGLFSNDFNPEEEVEALKREAGQEGMGLNGERDPALMTDEEIAAELLQLEQVIAERRTKKGTPTPSDQAA